MTRSWASLRGQFLTTPEGRTTYARARAELDAAWEVPCRYGCCLWWVTPDGDIGTVGPVGCKCKQGDDLWPTY